MYKRLLIFVFVLGLLLRTISLNSHPIGFTPDEASFGYDAYSLLHTGKDQWGNSFPLNFKSFGDYKLPIYTYLAMPLIALFDLSVTTTRLPNALLGSLAVIFTYLLVQRLFKDRRVAVFSAILLAISPWHVALSRGAFEANLTTSLLPLGLYLLHKGFDQKKYLASAALILGINMFTYHTARLMTVPVVLAFIFFFYKNKKFKLKNYLKLNAFWIILGIFVLLTGYAMLFGGGGRLATSSIFSLSDNIYNARFAQLHWGEPLLLNRLFNNKLTFLFSKFLHNYLSYFSPQFLFTEGAREFTYGMNVSQGVLYLFEGLGILTSIFIAVDKKKKSLLFLITWVLLSAVPAGLSIGVGHAANRAAFMMPAIHILSSFGLVLVFDWISKKFTKNLAITTSAVVIIFSFLFAFESYWFGQTAHGAQGMFYGTQELVEYVNKIEGQYDQIVISKRLSEPHAFFAFFLKTDPSVFQEFSAEWVVNNNIAWVDQQPSYRLGKYVFTNIDWQRERNLENTLVIGTYQDFPEKVLPVHTIYYPNGDPIFILVETRTDAFVYAK